MTQVPVQNFQPQVPDTSNGPHEHVYIPRSDGAVIINGVVYVRETKTPAPAPAPAPFAPTPVPVQDPYSGYYAQFNQFIASSNSWLGFLTQFS